MGYMKMKTIISLLALIVILSSLTTVGAINYFDPNTPSPAWMLEYAIPAPPPEHQINYFDNKYLMDNKPMPVVCLFEPETNANPYDTEALMTITMASLNNWVYQLKNFTGGGDEWHVGLKLITNETSYGKPTIQFRECDVNISFMGAPVLNIDTGGYFKGGAHHFSGDRNFVDIILFTWDYFPKDDREVVKNISQRQMDFMESTEIEPRHYEAKPTQVITLVSTISHELGHAWGLKHHVWNGEYNAEEFIPEHADQSIMYAITPRNASSVDVKHITELDVYAVVAKYGTDGWGGITNWKYDSFQIP